MPINVAYRGKINMSALASALALALGFVFSSFTCHCYGDKLQVGFYKGKCGSADVESIVAGVVASRFYGDGTIVAALLRLQFHDCFTKGCDASILLIGNNTERTAPANLGLRGFDIIDEAKAAVEKKCPGVVSCADIIVMAARDATRLASGLNLSYPVQTGRRDGLVSLARNVHLPPASISVTDSIAAFAQKNLSVIDMVYLIGGHTVGVAHCFSFQNRLYNFNNSGGPDTTMDPLLRWKLQGLCPQGSNSNNTAFLDQTPSSEFVVDNDYFKQIIIDNGILQIDQELALDNRTSFIVQFAALNPKDFYDLFFQAMVNLGAVQVLTGTQGEIRRNCSTVNNRQV